MPDLIESNAKIVSAEIGFEDHGIFTAVLTFDFGGARQGFGNYDLRVGNSAYKFISGILSTVGVIDWSKLPGTIVRVRRYEPRGLIKEIGHAIEDRWFVAERDIYSPGELR